MKEVRDDCQDSENSEIQFEMRYLVLFILTCHVEDTVEVVIQFLKVFKDINNKIMISTLSCTMVVITPRYFHLMMVQESLFTSLCALHHLIL